MKKLFLILLLCTLLGCLGETNYHGTPLDCTDRCMTIGHHYYWDGYNGETEIRIMLGRIDNNPELGSLHVEIQIKDDDGTWVWVWLYGAEMVESNDPFWFTGKENFTVYTWNEWVRGEV